jgi:DNA repair exonuclease SbcCD nuclease subunit
MGIDYLALGHIHTPYIIDGWIYNPGSIERTSVNDKVGGFYFYKDGDVSFTEFDVRPTYRMEVNVTNMDEEKIIKEIKNFVRKIPKPDISILQIKFSGRMNNIFSAKSLIPEGFFHTIVINETTFNSIQISLEKSDSNQIEKEVVDQITAGRDDVKDLIYKLISVVEPSDLTVDDILLLIGEVE